MKSVMDLLEPAIDATRRGKLKWQGEAESRFSATIASGTELVVWSGVDDGDSSWISIALLLGKDKEQVDRESRNEFQVGYDQLEKLLTVARRSANDVGSLISDLEKKLRNI